MAINDKLNQIKEIKEDIKTAINEKGVEVSDNEPFGNYANLISTIEGSAEGGDPFYEDLYNVRTNNGTNMRGLFMYSPAKSLDLTNLDTSKVTNMSYMFGDCSSLTTLNLSNFNTSNVTDMSYMFRDCKLLTTLNLSNFNTSKVIDMDYTFSNCSSLKSLDLSNFNTSNAISMDYMFVNCTALYSLNLSNCSENFITKIATVLPTRSSTNPGKAIVDEDLSETLINSLLAKYWAPVGPVFTITDIEIISTLDEMQIGGRTKLAIKSLNPWYADKNDIEFVISDDSVITIDENSYINALSLGTAEIYARYKNDHSVVSNTLVINVTETDSSPYVVKFKGSRNSGGSYYITVNGTKVLMTNLQYESIPGYGTVFTYDAGAPITSIRFNGYNSSSYGTSNITELIKLDTSNITNMSSMFSYCSNLTSLDLSNWDTSTVTDMRSMFYECHSLTSLDLSNFDTSNVTDMSFMFYNCHSLTSLNLSSFNTSSVKDMKYMFRDCTSLTSLDVSSFNTSKVTDMGHMFQHCNSLTSLDLSSFNTSNVTDMYGMASMFENCSSLTSLNLSNFNTYNIDTIDCEDMFIGVPDNVEWYYDETNYTAWTLSEFKTYYSGIFPWNKVYDEYYIEYTVPIGYSKPSLPIIYITDSLYNTVYPKVEITLLDGSITNKTNISTSNIKKIKVWYPRRAYRIAFIGSSTYPVHISGISYMKLDKIRSFYRLLYYCDSVSMDLSSLDTSNVTDMREVFYKNSSLKTLNLVGWDTSNVTQSSNMFYDVNYYSKIYVGSGWTLTPTQTNFIRSFCKPGIICDYVNDINTYESSSVYIDASRSNLFESGSLQLTWACENPNITLSPSGDTMTCNVTVYNPEMIDYTTIINVTNGYYSKECLLYVNYDEPLVINFTDTWYELPNWFREYDGYYPNYEFIHEDFNWSSTYGLVSQNAYQPDSTAWACYEITPPISGYLYIEFRYSGEDNCDILTAHLTWDSSQPYYDDSSNQIFTTRDNYYSDEYSDQTSPGYWVDSGQTYYLHFQYTKDSSNDSGLDKACIRRIYIE